MKKILLLFLSCFSCTIAEAQTTPPLFQGSDDVQLFRQALMERVTEVYYSDGYTPDDLIHYFWMNFTIDTLGRCIDLEIPDTCRRQTIIVKERTLELLRTALAGIDSHAGRVSNRLPSDREKTTDRKAVIQENSDFNRSASSGMPSAARERIWVSGLRIIAVSGFPGSTRKIGTSGRT